MRKRPLIITMTSVFISLIPFFGLAMVYSKFQPGLKFIPQSYLLIYSMMTLVCWIAAYGVYKVRPWGYYIFFSFLVGILALDSIHLLVIKKSPNLYHGIDALFLVLGAFLFRSKRIYEPYFNPQIRWWDRANRLQLHFKSLLRGSDGFFETDILDISETGCFLGTDKNLHPGHYFEFECKLEEYSAKCLATVVRVNSNPKGVGLMFVFRSKSEQKQIRQLIKVLYAKAKQQKKVQKKKEIEPAQAA